MYEIKLIDGDGRAAPSETITANPATAPGRPGPFPERTHSYDPTGDRVRGRSARRADGGRDRGDLLTGVRPGRYAVTDDERLAAAGAAAEALAPGRRDLGDGGPETETCGVSLGVYRCGLPPHDSVQHYDRRRRLFFKDLPL